MEGLARYGKNTKNAKMGMKRRKQVV